MGFDHENLQLYPPTGAASSPPFSALDRFLTRQTHFLQFQDQSNKNNYHQMEAGFGEFSSPYVGVGKSSNSWLLPSLHGDHDYSSSCYDHNFHGCIISTTKTHETMSQSNSESQDHPKIGASSNAKTSTRVRRGTSSTLVKRKWTNEEDKTLMKLVEEYGIKKWACIAQNLDGRTAKQCRERWQNHLRPDIKKDSWSEEEDKMFVEAHKKLGNRWSQIARRIPGRTENAVKNHWNAARRRRRQERVSKKKGSESLPKPSSFLQEYIKNNLYGTNGNTPHTKKSSPQSQDKINLNKTTLIPTTPISENSTLTPSLEPCEHEYEYEDSSLLINEPACDEELIFMLNLFNGNHQQPPGLLPPPPPLLSLDNRDHTISSWRGGFGERPSSAEFYGYHDYNHSCLQGVARDNFNGSQEATKGDSNRVEGRKDIDLIELVCSSLQ